MKSFKRMYLLIIIFLMIVSSFYFVNDSYAQNSLENPLRPIIDSGEGYGVAPGDPTPTKTPSEQVREKQSGIIKDIFLKLFGNETNKTPLPTSAQLPTPIVSLNPNTTVSPPTAGYTPVMPANTPETQYADQVVAIIHSNCRENNKAGIVTNSNRACINSLQPVMNEKGRAELYASPNESDKKKARYYLQCVACARAMAAARGRVYNGWGDAAQHIGINGKSNVAGYTYYSNTPTNYQQLVAGSLGISNKNHIWYITDVLRDTAGRPIKYRAYECNFGAKGLMQHSEQYDVDSSYFTGWQKPNTI